MLIWGISFVASKYVLAYLTPLTYMALRFVLSAAALGGFAARLKGPRLRRREHLLVFATALAEPIAYFLFESYGLTFTTASKAALIVAATPAMVMVAARLFLKEAMTRRGILAVALSIVGIALVVGGDPTVAWSEPGSYLGDLLVLGSVLSAAVYIVFARFLTQSHSPVKITFYQIAWGALVFVVLWAFQGPGDRVISLSPIAWMSMAFLVLGATLGAFLLYNFALSRVPAGQAALFINAIPVVTAVAGWAFLGERLSALQIVGGCVVVTSVAWNNLPGARRQSDATILR